MNSSTILSAASSAQNMANQTISTARADVLKEPLGFIKILQLLMAILAFSIAVNGGDTILVSIACPLSRQVNSYATYSYPYSLSTTQWTPRVRCPNQTAIETRTSISDSSASIVASSGFFVFTGVMAFLYSLAFLIIYVFFKHKYDNILFFSSVDFLLTSLLSLFWFIGAIAFAKAVDDVRTEVNVYGDASLLKERFVTCAQPNTICSSSSTYSPTFASLIIACIFGFGNLILWAGNVWFVLKETAWYKARSQLQAAEQQQQQSSATATSASYNPDFSKI